MPEWKVESGVMAPPVAVQEPDPIEALRRLKGVVATVVTTGKVEELYMQNMMEMHSWADRAGFWNIEWRTFVSPFVETGRDEVVKHTLAQNYDFCVQIDADASFPSNTLLKLLHSAFILQPDSDVMGAYSQLKGKPNLPTIDTGTGTWEPHYPGEGILPVIRTGGHCLLIKRGILQQLAPGPWFRVREAMSPIRAFQEVDNFARIKLDGQNPLAESPAWGTLLQAAKASSGGGLVGEDSGFSDRVLAAGGRMYVNADIVTGHVTNYLIQPADLKRNMDEIDRARRLICGLLT